MTKRTLILSGSYRVLPVATIRLSRRHTFGTQTPASLNQSRESASSQTIDSSSPSVAPTIADSTHAESVSGGKQGRLTLFLSRWRSFQFPATTTRAHKLSKRHYGLSHLKGNT